MLQGQELFVILLVALIVLGPRRLPEMARKMGVWTAELRRAAREIRSGLEAEISEVKEISKEFEAPVRDLKESLRESQRLADETAAATRWIGPKPVSGPTPEDAMADLARIEETGRPVTDEPEVDTAPPSPAATADRSGERTDGSASAGGPGEPVAEVDTTPPASSRWIGPPAAEDTSSPQEPSDDTGDEPAAGAGG